MKLTFYKYEGTGNDFIVIDNRKLKLKLNPEQIRHLCHRRFGIGGDGLIFLQNRKGVDFEMIYFNADGKEGSFCGNGSRCMVAFAKKMGLVKQTEIKFYASDGIHTARIKGKTIRVKMNNVKNIEATSDYYYLNTGSPHYVKFSMGVKSADILAEGRLIRYSNRFKKKGVNVNIAEKNGKGIFIRTYERGVEGETFSCGTGATAVALASAIKGISTSAKYTHVITLGGELTIHFQKETDNSFTNIWLEGPATFVFKGEITI